MNTVLYADEGDSHHTWRGVRKMEWDACHSAPHSLSSSLEVGKRCPTGHTRPAALFLLLRSYGPTATPIHGSVCGHVCATMAMLNSGNWDCMTCKAQNIDYLAFYGKSHARRLISLIHQVTCQPWIFADAAPLHEGASLSSSTAALFSPSWTRLKRPCLHRGLWGPSA